MRVLVTRPQPQADEWVRQLRAQGIDAHALPLLGIDEAPDASALHDAWAALVNLGAAARPTHVMFVSPNAVNAFFEAAPGGSSWPADVCAGGPGPGTARALRACGVPADLVREPAEHSAQFDAEALWAALQAREGGDWRARHVLIVRGDGGRETLADHLRAAGAEVRYLQAYARGAPVLDAPARALLARAQAEPTGHLWLFSSSQAIGELKAMAPGADWSAARALASHPRIAATARALGFGRVGEVRPAFDAVLDAVRRADAA